MSDQTNSLAVKLLFVLMNEICAEGMMSYGPCLSLYFARKVFVLWDRRVFGFEELFLECWKLIETCEEGLVRLFFQVVKEFVSDIWYTIFPIDWRND